MNLAVIHYHLNRGGVTRVIENQIRALDAVLDPGDPWRVSIFYGGRRRGWIEKVERELHSIHLTLVEVPGLEYDTPAAGPPAVGSPDLSDSLRLAFEHNGFGPGETVVHVHNHALGKNRALPTAVARLAEAGFCVLLQVHDFAEDFRPENYRRLVGDKNDKNTLGKGTDAGRYPQADDIYYATLNSRDQGILAAAGVEPRRLRLLPNPVPSLKGLPDRGTARRRLQQRRDVADTDRFLFYPVRCIRRKNIGEALLYSALAPAATVVGLALPPLNPAEIPIYTAWKDCARRLELPCRFEVGGPDGLSFEENLAAADAIITTSVAEGFGMVFLESWLAGRPLIGRDLPEISGDFRRAGLRFDWMEASLKIPLDWIGADRFRATFLSTYRQVLEAYGRDEPSDLDEAIDFKTSGGMVDFADLDEPLQQTVIQRVVQSQRHRATLLEANRWLQRALDIDTEAAAEVINENAQAIRVGYGLKTSGQSLLALYNRAHASRPDVHANVHCQALPNTAAILDRFLDPRRFRLIRS